MALAGWRGGVSGKRPIIASCRRNPGVKASRAKSECVLLITSKHRESENATFEGAALFHKILCQLGKNGVETLQLLQQAYKKTQCHVRWFFMWHKRFKDGREDAEDDRAGRPATSRNEENLAKLREVLNSDRHLSIRLIADRMNLNYGTVFQMVTEDLMMRKVCAKFVPKVLTDDQKQRRVAVAQEMLERLQVEPNFLDKVVTGDETWVFEYDPSRNGKAPSGIVNSPNRKNPHEQIACEKHAHHLF